MTWTPPPFPTSRVCPDCEVAWTDLNPNCWNCHQPGTPGQFETLRYRTVTLHGTQLAKTATR